MPPADHTQPPGHNHPARCWHMGRSPSDVFCYASRSNVMPPSKEGFSGDKHLHRRIIANRGGVELRVRWSKTNQFRSKVTTYPLPRVKGHPLCPSQAVFHALGCTRGAPRDGPAFVFRERGEWCPLTPDIFIAAIRAALEASVSDVSLYAGHSFRRGGACWAYERGVPIDTIRQTGDWKSDAYTAYIFQDGPALSRAIAPMASELPQVWPLIIRTFLPYFYYLLWGLEEIRQRQHTHVDYNFWTYYVLVCNIMFWCATLLCSCVQPSYLGVSEWWFNAVSATEAIFTARTC